jgi:tetratricopeptide (TPR) repeat protein
MPFISLRSFLPVLLLAACAQPVRQADVAVAPSPAQPQPAAVAAAPAAPKDPDLPKIDLSERLLFELLLAEIAGQRGDAVRSSQAYTDLARRTRDPRVARRATEMSLYARNQAQAAEAAALRMEAPPEQVKAVQAQVARSLALAAEAGTIWVETDPESMQALQALTGILVNANQTESVRPYLERLLAKEPDSTANSLLQLNRLLQRVPDKAAALRLIRELTAPYAKLAEAHFAVAQAALIANDEPLALTEIRAAQELRPEWEGAALFEAQLLQRESSAAAIARLQAFLKTSPRAREARTALARLLVGDKQYPEARAQFQALLDAFPDDTDVIFAVGILSIQLADFARAEANLRRLLDLDYKDKPAIHLYLGQIAEDQKQYDLALARYTEVGSGEHFLMAQVRAANVLAKQGKIDDARRHLQAVPASGSLQRAQLMLAEAQLLREANQLPAAFEFLGESLEKLPNHPELLYEYAMLAEKLGRNDVLEASLRKLIAVKPDHAHAYNALGYSLADRNIRLDEALQFIDKAMKLAPDDAFIVDSMGWVQFRLGNLEDSLRYIRRAYGTRRDPDIAAHLGEVLWALGRRDEAKRVWQDAAKTSPDNEALLNTMKRFTP